MRKENISLYYKVSAKTGEFVDMSFKLLAQKLIMNESKNKKPDSTRLTMDSDASKDDKGKEKKKCCG